MDPSPGSPNAYPYDPPDTATGSNNRPFLQTRVTGPAASVFSQAAKTQQEAEASRKRDQHDLQHQGCPGRRERQAPCTGQSDEGGNGQQRVEQPGDSHRVHRIELFRSTAAVSGRKKAVPDDFYKDRHHFPVFQIIAVLFETGRFIRPGRLPASEAAEALRQPK